MNARGGFRPLRRRSKPTGGVGHPRRRARGDRRGRSARFRRCIAATYVYVFDLLHLDGIDFRQDRLTNRRALVEAQLGLHRHRMIEAFEDGDRLLFEAELMGLEGNADRGRLFSRSRPLDGETR